MHVLRRALIALSFFICGFGAAIGHPMPNSVVALDIGEAAVSGRVTIPLIELDLALGSALAADPDAAILAATPELETYLAAHIGATTPDGDPWTIRIGALSADTSDNGSGAGDLVAEIELVPPAGASVRDFSLAYDAVIERVVTHCAVVSIATDWLAGQVESVSDGQIGIIRVNPVDGSVAPLQVSLDSGSYWQGFVAMLGLGASHIAEGTDHLLFLFTLLLAAPLVAVGGRWRADGALRPTLWSIAAIVTSFTLGHSLALIVATLTRIQIAQQPVEIAIALTILISAVHVAKPIFPRREPLVAGLFGLVHGMAFSFTLAALDLSTPQLAVSLLGFNLGIELFQLGLVILALPALVLFARSGVYAPLRIAGAGLAIIASLGWLADRLGLQSGLAVAVDALGAQLPWGLAGLTLLAIVTWLVRGRPQRAA